MKFSGGEVLKIKNYCFADPEAVVSVFGGEGTGLKCMKVQGVQVYEGTGCSSV